MKNFLLFLLLTIGFIHAQTINVFDNIPFYSMYHYLGEGQTLPPEAYSEIPSDAIRFHAYERDVVSRKLSDSDVLSLGDNITLNVTLFAACDNYDRIAGVNLALVPKFSTTYNWNDTAVKRIEIGRFITPFMNKNISPTQVPYTWQINNLSKILKDSDLLANYDMWIEFRADGYSAAANTQVAGCAGRTDVFRGSLELVSTTGEPNLDQHHLEPIKHRFIFNNYQSNAYDLTTPNLTEKSFEFTLAEPLEDAKLYLITSKHGSNSGGEEYIRRFHYVYLNNNLIHTYRPNETPTCEPFRQYNTQGNGIYGTSPQSNNWWSSWNNWCPGDKIPTKEISLGNLAAGDHSVKFRLTGNNLFAGGQGYVVISLYVQGKRSPLSTQNFVNSNVTISPNPTKDYFNIESEKELMAVEVYNNLGQVVLKSNNKQVNISPLNSGLYFVKLMFEGSVSYSKIFKE